MSRPRGSGPYQIAAITTPVAVICLVNWPWATLCALAGLAGAIALLAGLRGLIRGPKSRTTPTELGTPAVDSNETGPGVGACAGCIGCGGPDCIQRPDGCGPECAEGHMYAYRCALMPPPLSPWTILGAGLPDASGPHPDTTRTDPDAPGHHTADQAGHDPDTIRTPADEQLHHQLADALGRNIHTPWPDLITAAFRAYRAADLLAGAERERQDAEVALTTAVRARKAAEQRARRAEAAVEVWQANAELAAGQRDQARTAIARVREQCAEWARPIKSGSWDAQIRDDIAASCAEMILRALDTPAVDQPAVDHEHVVQATTKQPVSDPQPLDESDPDTCHVVHIDGEPVRIHGQSDMTPETAGYFAEVVRAAKRKHAAEHPDSAAHSVAPTTTKDSPVTRYDELSEDARNLMAGFDELDIAEIAADAQRSATRLRNQITKTETERDGAYRERAQLLAWLAALHPAVRTLAPDVTEPGWQILYLNPTTGGQMSWHIAPQDIELFEHVEYVPAGSGDQRALWDGHTTEQKYDRIATVTAELAQRCGPECAEGHAYTGRCESATTTTKGTSGRLLDCGLCYEENGEEVHPHPECALGGPVATAEQEPDDEDEGDDDPADSDSDVLALISEIASRLTDATDEGEYQAAGLIGDLANGRKTIEEAREELADITFRHV